MNPELEVSVGRNEEGVAGRERRGAQREPAPCEACARFRPKVVAAPRKCCRLIEQGLALGGQSSAYFRVL
jgi:hypothetical protein